jgi:hypothetical protein
MKENNNSRPIVGLIPTQDGYIPLTAKGKSIVIHEWKGSGPPWMHVHHEDDEAWHILEGRLHFRFLDHSVSATAGMTIFVPAGVAHTYDADAGSRYLVILTPRLDALIKALQISPPSEHKAIMATYKSEILENG